MAFRNFRFICTLRVLLITATIILQVYLYILGEYMISSGALVIALVVQIISLIKYVESTNYKVTQFLESIRYSDFTATFSSTQQGRSFTQLNKSFNEVIEEFRKTRREKEEHFNYLQTVVQHVSISIIVFEHDGSVDLINNAFKKLFAINNLHNIKELSSIDPKLPNMLMNLKSDHRELLKLEIDNELVQLSVNATAFRMRDENFTLISLQDIHYELEEKEMESWQKLTRVLTHEIMNSITPITSLASTVKEMVSDDDNNPLPIEDIDDETIENIQSSLSTIERRSRGLLNFVNIYRNLTRIPKPNFRYFNVKELLQRVIELHQQQLKSNNTQHTITVAPDNLMLLADPDLIEQVLINLVINSIHATEGIDNPRIDLSAEEVNGKISIHITDNGKGIKQDMIEKIFIPFFTSKKDGSGIGLSLSRQIMFMHKGSIAVKSEAGVATMFTLKFY